jgi:hypothetical protein
MALVVSGGPWRAGAHACWGGGSRLVEEDQLVACGPSRDEGKEIGQDWRRSKVSAMTQEFEGVWLPDSERRKSSTSVVLSTGILRSQSNLSFLRFVKFQAERTPLVRFISRVKINLQQSVDDHHLTQMLSVNHETIFHSSEISLKLSPSFPGLFWIADICGSSSSSSLITISSDSSISTKLWSVSASIGPSFNALSPITDWITTARATR